MRELTTVCMTLGLMLLGGAFPGTASAGIGSGASSGTPLIAIEARPAQSPQPPVTEEQEEEEEPDCE